MAWREASIVQQRFEFVTLATAEGANVADLCRRFGISRETGYKWIARFKLSGRANLENQPRRPRTSPDKTSAAIEAAVIALRDKHPAWGGRKLRARLLALGQTDVPAASTITAILRRHARIDPAESCKHTAAQRFERERPNELWQMDFKGHVPMHIGGRCHPLTVLDDHSRFAVGLWACNNERRETVQGHLTAMFRRYGLPERVLCDNGPPWGAPQGMGRHTHLTVWLLRLGVRVSHGRPRHPQTQGKDERFHRTLNAELLTRQDLRDMRHAQGLFDDWRDVYNLERPNEALGLMTPASRYQPSERIYPETLPDVEFSPGDIVRRVRHDGSFNFVGRVWFIGEAFAREYVGVRRTAQGVIEARYGPHLVGSFLPPAPATARAPRCPRAPLSLAALALAPPVDNAESQTCQ